MPLRNLVALSQEAKLDAGVTIDFEATAELGQPMVVLRVPSEPTPHPCLDSLSKREREVAALVAKGLANKEIAKTLFISLLTVKDHVHRILEKIGCSNRAGIVAAVLGQQPHDE